MSDQNSTDGSALIVHGPPTPEEQRTAIEDGFKTRQLNLTKAANRLSFFNLLFTLVLAVLTFIGAQAAWYQAHIADRNATSAEKSAAAADSAAKTASATLKEMQTGQGAQDTHKFALAAQTQAEASKISARAAKSAANTAKAALEAQSSPWLGIEKDEADFVPPRAFQRDGSIELTFAIRLHNYGSGPALDVSIYVPEKTTGGKYSGTNYFHQSNVCAEPNQAERDVAARKYYGVEHIVWPSDQRDFTRTIITGTSPASYFPGCISYRGRSGVFQHTLFIYRIHVRNDPADPTPTIPKVDQVTLVGLEPQ